MTDSRTVWLPYLPEDFPDRLPAELTALLLGRRR